MSKVYFGLSGSDANETNIKMVWYYNNILGRPNKKKIISRWRGYHGSGLATGSLTGLDIFHKKFDLPIEYALSLQNELPFMICGFFTSALPNLSSLIDDQIELISFELSDYDSPEMEKRARTVYSNFTKNFSGIKVETIK